MSLSLISLLPTVRLRWKNLSFTCGYRDCPTRQFVRILPGRRQGIRAGERWYCSIQCFQQDSCATLSELCNRPGDEIRRQPRLSIGLVLLSKGYLTAEQLRTATNHSQWFEEDLESTLLRLGLTTERQLAAARSAQWGYPVLSNGYPLKPVLLDLPRSVLSAFSAVPIEHSISAKRILVGFGSRVDHSLLESIEYITGCRAVPCFVTGTEAKELAELAVTSPEYREVLLEEPETAEEIARTVGRVAAQVDAKDVKFTRCQDLVWVRLTRERIHYDVVLHLPGSGEHSESEESDLVVNWG